MAASKGMAQGDEFEGSSTGKGPPDGLESLAIENQRLREDLRQAEMATGEFVDFVAHELKQPMTAMQGYSKMLILGLGGELTPTQRQFVDVIDANVERMGKLINDLLEVCRLEAGRTRLNLAPVSLKEILYETVVNNRAELEARHHTVEIDVPDDLPPVLGDRDRLVQILAHLVRNACRYTPEGGHVRLVAGEQNGDAGPGGHADGHPDHALRPLEVQHAREGPHEAPQAEWQEDLDEDRVPPRTGRPSRAEARLEPTRGHVGECGGDRDEHPGQP